MTNDRTTKSQLRVSLLGFGRVGSNVYRLLTGRRAEIERVAGRPVVVAHILVEDQAELEAADAERSLLTTDTAEALDADVVVEMIGGAEASREEILKATAVALAVGGGLAQWPARFVFKILEELERSKEE